MMLPLHPQVRPNEILSSWMVRLAFANGFPLHTFYANLLGYKAPIWNRDTDRHPAQALLDVLIRHTDQSSATLQTLTLNAYNGILFEQLPLIGTAPWILPVGVFHRTRRRAGMQFCPVCLQLDTVPYYRRTWRLALYAMCEYHQCVMQEHCPSCHAPVAYHRHGIGRRKTIPEQPLRLCHYCGFDLSRTHPIYLNWPDARSWLLFGAIISLFEQGAWYCGQLTPPCGVPFFQGFHSLVSVINGRYGHRLRQHLGKTFGLTIGSDHPAQHLEFEHLSAQERLKLLLAATWLLDDWPNRFVELCIQTRFTRSRMAEDLHSLPFWLACVIDEYLDCRPYIPSDHEIIAAGNYLHAHEQPVSSSTLGQLLGLSRDMAGAAWHLWQLQLGLSPKKPHDSN